MITVIYFWKINPRDIFFAILGMAIDRTLLRRTYGVTFAKMLGCGRGETFTTSDADPTRWGCLVVLPIEEVAKLDQSVTVRRWRAKSTSEFRVLLEPISVSGKWSKQSPFIVTTNEFSNPQIVAITRARIKAWQTARFFKSVPPVTASLHQSPGLISAIGIGEAPIGLQGTFSLWESAKAIRDFAYKGAAHQKAIEQTSQYDWYAEELFARFAVLEKRGSL
jgi:hypothetical protein